MMDAKLGELGFLGDDFQVALASEIIKDQKFGETLIDILNPNSFEIPQLRQIIGKIKEHYESKQVIPTFKDLDLICKTEFPKETRPLVAKIIAEMDRSVGYNTLVVQDKAMKFFKQQSLKKAIYDITGILEKGNFERYDEAEEILKKALSVGDKPDDGIDVFSGLEDVLSDDFRNPTRTGIDGLDIKMDGGLGKGELGVILAPFGVGKTTMITKIANTAYNEGLTVVQIFFEDNPKVIKRKHLSCWSGVKLNDLAAEKDEVFKIAKDRQENSQGNLILKKMPSDGTTIPMIRQFLRRLISKGVRPDMVLVDYIDCVAPTKQFKDEYAGEGNVMRQFETMLDEMNLIGWTAVQGNRSSIGAAVVEGNQIGGSIKKGQIGHFIVSIAKTLQQKEEGTANIAIIKSRFGQDGIIFENAIFDNGRIQIQTENEGKTTAQTREEKSARDQARVIERMALREQVLGNIKNTN